MKKNLLLSLFFFSFYLGKAQWVSIPDTNFGKWLNTNGYSVCLQGNSQVGWQMDTSCPAVVGAIKINCTYQNIKNFTGISYFHNLDTFISNSNRVSLLPPLPDSLIYLECSFTNTLTSFPPLPNTLTWLDIAGNRLTNLPPLPSGLLVLDCGYNSINSLTVLPNGLTKLWCTNNQLTALPNLPSTLTYLHYDNNSITVLASLPASLTQLTCARNNITNLPVLPNGLEFFSCSYNSLVSLPALPDSLFHLDCRNNNLASLPSLPSGISQLHCQNNGLTSLPVLPNNIYGLWCDSNQLVSLPNLPPTLRYLYCSNNNITALPALGRYFGLYINNNPISCLPLLQNINDFDFTGTNITCLPNYGNVTNSNPLLNSLPLCDVFNSNGCSTFWNISGKVYADGNLNCAFDANDSIPRNIKVELKAGGVLLQQAFIGQGFYSFDTDTLGTLSVNVDTGNIPLYVSCPSNNLQFIFLTALDSFADNNDFAVKCKTGFDLTAHSIHGGGFRPATYVSVDINTGDFTNFYGVRCAAGVSGVVTVTITGSVTYISPANSALTPTVSGNVLTYNIADFGNVNFFSDFNIVVQTDTNAVIGSQVCFTVSVTPTTGDNNPANNVLTHCFTVVAAYDPNDKQVYPLSDVDVNGERLLTYTVNFQNTGTDTAIHIYITDTLDADLDASTFQLLAYSHQPLVQLKESAVRFNFPNIYLVDSNANEPLSHGYVQYKIKIKDGKPVGTIINNTAYIYFDFNAPVVTNTTTNTITTSTGISPLPALREGLGVGIFPNPATNQLTISLGGLPAEQVRIYSTDGRLVIETKQPANNWIDISSLAKGVYVAEVKVRDAVQRVRWVKM